MPQAELAINAGHINSGSISKHLKEQVLESQINVSEREGAVPDPVAWRLSLNLCGKIRDYESVSF